MIIASLSYNGWRLSLTHAKINVALKLIKTNAFCHVYFASNSDLNNVALCLVLCLPKISRLGGGNRMGMSGRRTATRGVIGRLARRGKTPSKRSESNLEFDFYKQLSFFKIPFSLRPEIKSYQTPSYRYILDLKINWGSLDQIQWLVEVKYREDLEDNITKYQNKLLKSYQFAKMTQAEFMVLTEAEIRSTFGKNIDFLHQFAKRQPNTEACEEIMMLLGGAKEIEIKTFTQKLDTFLLASFWKMIAHDMLFLDLFEPITLNSIVMVPSQIFDKSEHRLRMLQSWKKQIMPMCFHCNLIGLI